MPHKPWLANQLPQLTPHPLLGISNIRSLEQLPRAVQVIRVVKIILVLRVLQKVLFVMLEICISDQTHI